MLALRAGVAQGGERIGGLTRLGDQYGRAALLHRRLAITKFRSDIDIDRHPRDLLKPIAADHGGIKSGAAGGEGDAADFRQIEWELGQVDRALGGTEVGVQGLADNRRLLVDFLLHEVAEIALADERSRGRGLTDFALDDPTVHAVDNGAVGDRKSVV